MSSHRETILIVDDTGANIDMLSSFLEEKYDIMATLDGAYGIELATEEQPDLILLDIVMPGMDGYEVCRLLKESPKTEKIPVVFITAETDEKSIAHAYDVGGADYISKPFKPKELFARVHMQLQIKALIGSLEASKRELALLAATDYLTKLYNRRYFSEESRRLIRECNPDTQATLCIIDIDNFKHINDTYGHNIGDQVIRHLADMLMLLKNEGDMAARYGGEEFALLMFRSNTDSALEIAEMIRRAVADSVVETGTGNSLQYTISIGISSIDTDKENPMDSAFIRADKALYRAKNSGKNLVCFELKG